MTLTREEVQALLEGITSGEWQADEKGVISPGQLSHGRDYRRIANVHVRASYATPELDVENGANSRLLANASALARQLLAEMDARQAAEMKREWQPIETAPRDGTVVLLWNDYTEAFTGFYGKNGWQNWFMRCQGNHHPAPSHWMPLPAPPSQALSPQPEPAEGEV